MCTGWVWVVFSPPNWCAGATPRFKCVSSERGYWLLQPWGGRARGGQGSPAGVPHKHSQLRRNLKRTWNQWPWLPKLWPWT